MSQQQVTVSEYKITLKVKCSLSHMLYYRHTMCPKSHIMYYMLNICTKSQHTFVQIKYTIFSDTLLL